MQLFNWSRSLSHRRRRRRERTARRELFAPVRLALRRLEQRRVLDVSAAFMTGTGVLELDVTNTSDVATLQDSGGNVEVRDAGNNRIDVDVDMGGAGSVAWSDVKRIEVRGDVVADQGVVFDTSLALDDGLQVDGNIESIFLTESVTSLAALELGGDVVLENDIALFGSELTFAGTIDSQSNATHSLTINAGAGAVVFNGDIGANVSLRGLEIQQAGGGVRFGETLPMQMINSTDAVTIGSTEVIGGAGIVFNGGASGSLRINTTGDDVTIKGAVELRSSLSIDTGGKGGDIHFTDASPIDSQPGATHDLTLNAGDGQARLHQNVGSAQAIGKLTITSAAGGVTIGTDAAPIANVHAAHGINIGAGANEITGLGIVFNGGSSPLALTTDNTDIRLNGRTTLASSVLLDTGSGLGDVTLTNDTPVDSQAGEFNDLSVNAGAGSVFFNEDLGRTNRLGSLTVMTADGVVFGQSTTEVPGAGGRGPVEVVNTDGEITIGAGTDSIGGAGIEFRGSAIARAVITTSGGDVLIHGATRLATDLTVSTGSGGGNLTFTSDSPVDAASGSTSSLTVDLGSGALFFNADIGGNEAIGRLTVASAKGGVTFGDTAPVHVIRARQPIDIGAGSNVIEGTGITFSGGNSALLLATSSASVRLNGPIRAASDLAIDTGDGAGAIVLTSNATIDSADGAVARSAVTLDAGQGAIAINANLGSQQRLAAFTIERAAGGVVIGGADVGAPGGAGPVTHIATAGPTSVGSLAVISGGIALNGGSLPLLFDTAAANLDFNGPLEIRSDVAIQTGAGGGDLILSAAATLDSQPAEANGLSIDLGAGNVLLQAALGALNPLGELRIVAVANVTAESDIDADRIVQLAGSGTTVFEGGMNTTAASLPGIELTGNAFVFRGPIATQGDVSISHTGLLDIQAAADMRLEGAFHESGSGAVEIAANIITSGGDIRFASPVTLAGGAAGDLLFDTTSGGSVAGAAISFDETVDAQSAGGETLTLNAGAFGDITFQQAIGAATRLGQLRIIDASDVTLSDSLLAANFLQDAGHGTTTFQGTVDTSSVNARSIDVNTVNVSFLDAVSTSGDGRVELTVSGILQLAAAAEMNLDGSLVQDGGGLVHTSANITTSEDDIMFMGDVILAESVRFETGPGTGDLLFAGTLDGANDCQENMTLALGAGNALFQGEVGGSAGLGNVLIEQAANVRFASSLLASSIVQTAGGGETRFDGAVSIKSAAAVDLKTVAVTISSGLDASAAAAPIRIAASDDIAIDHRVTTGGATVTLSAGSDVLLGSNAMVATLGADVMIHADAAAAGSGGAVGMSDGAVIDAGGGVIQIAAGENIQLGRLVTTALVRLTSTGGAIVDAGNSSGADIVADQLAIRTLTGVGSANPIDTSVNIIAVENRRSGGVRFENATGGSLAIGNVDGLSGIMNGPSAAPEKLAGNVELIHAGAIDVTAPILNDGGSHTIIRAELPGDLVINAPIQNRGGDGWIVLFSGGDLVIHHSLPEPQAEISVENEGAIRGEARGDVRIDNSDSDYVIVRTHSERFPNVEPLPTLSAKFADPARYPPPSETAFYTELEAELRAIRESVSAQATNFEPIFDIESVDQGGSNVDASGRAIVKVTIGDGVHLETNWHFTIDWGDGTIESYTVPGNPQASLGFLTTADTNTNALPDLTNTARLDSGVGGEPGVYFVHHRYLSPPDPSDPAAPVPIFATLRYDAREEGEQTLDLGRPSDGSSIFNGIRFFRNGTEPVVATDEDVLTNPGEGSFFFIKIVDSVIVPVESRQVTTVYAARTTTTTTVTAGSTFEFIVASFEAETVEEYRLFMRVVDDVVARAVQAQLGKRIPTAGEGTREYPLDLKYLDDPLAVFRDREFPNGHYRIYLEEIRTGRIRLILDVHIYEGRVVPENFREGAAERQPGSGDGARLESHRDLLVDRTASGTKAEVENAADQAGNSANARPEVDAHEGTGVPHRSGLLLPAAAMVPWRARLRMAPQSETRAISRTSLRLRRHR